MPRISSVRRIRQMEFFMYTYDIEQLLKNGSAVKLKPQGYSMYPLFLPGRDEAVIEHCVPSELHRGDVILYRRVQGILVLHRICRITRDGFYLVGDNQTEVEGPLSPEQIHGKLTGVVRNGKSFSVSHPIYRMLSSIWLFLPSGFLINGVLRLILVILFFIAFLNITYAARHTFATTVTLANNVPLQEVSAMLGHASTRMTQHYARVMDRNLKDNMNIVRSKMGL